MSSTLTEISTATSKVNGNTPGNKSKKEKHERKDKKRPRETEDDDDQSTHRKHKKSKSLHKIGSAITDTAGPDHIQPAETMTSGDPAVEKTSKKDKKRKRQHDHNQAETGPESSVPVPSSSNEATVEKAKKDTKQRQIKDEQAVESAITEVTPAANETSRPTDEAVQEPRKAAKKERREKKAKKKALASETQGDLVEKPSKKEKKLKEKQKLEHIGADADDAINGDAMDLDAPEPEVSAEVAPILAPPHAPKKPTFPFFTRTVSLYVPVYPEGWNRPVSTAVEQHLEPYLRHRYSDQLGGMLLGIRNATLGERSTRRSSKNPQTDEEPALLHTVDEYAVGFGFLTADLDLFIPSRGAWLEGVVNVQTEGHIGLLCWDRWSASIERKRLPKGWRYVDAPTDENQGESQVEEEDAVYEDDIAKHIQGTGYWVDDRGRKVHKIHCQIRNFDVGHGYLSIEGTMLDEESEKRMANEEMQAEKARRRKGDTGFYRPRHRVPNESITMFEPEGGEENASQRR